jgi:hypothetical protein
LEQWVEENVPDGYRYQPATDWTGAGWVRPNGVNRMPGIAEYRALGEPTKLIIAELPRGEVMLTVWNTITGERQSITLPRTEAHAASHTLRSARFSWARPWPTMTA